MKAEQCVEKLIAIFSF